MYLQFIKTVCQDKLKIFESNLRLLKVNSQFKVMGPKASLFIVKGNVLYIFF